MVMKYAAPETDTYPETLTTRLAPGTQTRIDGVLKGGEVRSVFVRHAIEAELMRREKKLAEVRAKLAR